MRKQSRREFISKLAGGSVGVAAVSFLATGGCRSKKTNRLPNILFAISDDQSWAYTGANGCKIVNTPNFDRVAREGVLFTNAYSAAPQCSPSRAAILTGRYIWQLEEAGTHASSFPKKFKVYPDLLEAAGYWVGYTGKPWAPGNWKVSGWKRNPAGPEYNQHELKELPFDGISETDYAANFKEFYDKKPAGKPFCFWYGGREPHRKYEKGSGLRVGKKLEDVRMVPFLPDYPEIRSDFLDFAVEVDWFDEQLGRMLAYLEEKGELDNTIVVVTSDNGIPFPRAKANNYEYGVHMPLAIRWPERVKGGRVVDDLVSFVDFAPTFLQAAGLPVPDQVTGKSFLNILTSDKSGRVDETRTHVLTGRERHTHARPDNVGYPCRSIRTFDYLYIWNVKPDRWPAGDPTGSGRPEGYHDIDASPTKTFMIRHKDEPGVKKYFRLGFGKRPEEELYDMKNDPGCVKNLAYAPEYKEIKDKLQAQLKRELKQQGDPRMLGYGDIFESYPRYSHMRDFPGFKKSGEYNPKYQVKRSK